MTELRLPFPVSVNAMYVNRGGRGRNRYPSPEFKAWTTQAGIELNLQKPRKFENRVVIDIDLDESRQGDCDSRTKCVVDLLVKHKVIHDDRKKFVQRVSIGWAAITGCRVRIAEAA